MENPQKYLVSENPNDRMRLMDRALQKGTGSDLEALFESGIDINQTDFEGRTALMMSAVFGKRDVVEMLIKRGADVNKIYMYQGRIPQTALDAARESKKSEIEQILLAHGAKTGKELQQA